MWCPVHHVSGCVCQYARVPKLLALSLAAVLVACGGKPCTPSDLPLTAHEADCLARVQAECAGIPLDQPCAFEEQCLSYTRERCK